MQKFCLLLTFVSFLLSSCATDHNIETFLGANDLAALCQNTNEDLVFTAQIFVDKRDQLSFFGDILPESVVPIFVCISNGTDRTFGVNDKDFNLDFNENNSSPLRASEKTPQNDEDKGGGASIAAFVVGTAVVGILPGILLAVATQNRASSKATEVILHMIEKKLSSGLIHPSEVRAGFLYFEKPKLLELTAISSSRIQCELLDLGIGRKISIVSVLSGI